jgi:hypothetical protein
MAATIFSVAAFGDHIAWKAVGDRVRLSRELERDAVEAGYVEAWQHTNARRSAERRAYRLRRLFPRKAPRLAGQILLPLPEITRPVSRLRDFGGGLMPASVAREIKFRYQQRGLSQSRLGQHHRPEPRPARECPARARSDLGQRHTSPEGNPPLGRLVLGPGGCRGPASRSGAPPGGTTFDNKTIDISMT